MWSARSAIQAALAIGDCSREHVRRERLILWHLELRICVKQEESAIQLSENAPNLTFLAFAACACIFARRVRDDSRFRHVGPI